MDRSFIEPQNEPEIPPAPEFGMSLTGQGEEQMGQPAPPGPSMLPQLQGPGPTADPNVQGGPTIDQTLNQLIAAAQATPGPVKPTKKTPPPPSIGLIMSTVNSQILRYSERDARIVRDLALVRHNTSFVPSSFNKVNDYPVHSGTIPNLVLKLANMLSAPEPRVIVSFSDEQSKLASQSIENFCYWLRRTWKRYYSRSGGATLQWDEFWYMLVHGTLVCRILPDPLDDDYPFNISLMDPASCYPIFKGDKGGIHTMIRRYNSTMLDIIHTYGDGDDKLEQKLMDKLGNDRNLDPREVMDEEGETIEYWDKYYRAVIFRGMVVMEPKAHNLGCVPFVHVVARGEPKSLSTPDNGWAGSPDEYNNVGYAGSRTTDLAYKATSVFQHLIKANRVSEILATLSLMEVEKAMDPATVTYVSPMYQGESIPPLNTRKRGNNKRILNHMKVEAIPTSPRPTDFSPILNKVMMDIQEGSLPSVSHGNESGSNVSGFAVESLIAVAKDTILPYTQAFEVYLAQVFEMSLKQYEKFILPLNTLTVPGKKSYGNSVKTEITQDVLDQAGDDFEVRLLAMSQQMLPGQINAASMAVQSGIWPIRKAMEHTGSLDPDNDFRDIISERAIQHPEIMENYLIPQGFMQKGQDEMAQLWMQLVVMPKMMQSMMGGAPPGGGGGGAPPGAPQPNGQSNPVVGKPTASGGGADPGQGRGAAMQQ